LPRLHVFWHGVRRFGAIFLLAGLAIVAVEYGSAFGAIHVYGSVWAAIVVGSIFARVGDGITFHRSRPGFWRSSLDIAREQLAGSERMVVGRAGNEHQARQSMRRRMPPWFQR
jgi:hypothetical protein